MCGGGIEIAGRGAACVSYPREFIISIFKIINHLLNIRTSITDTLNVP